jgi:hypothetical protein
MQDLVEIPILPYTTEGLALYTIVFKIFNMDTGGYDTVTYFCACTSDDYAERSARAKLEKSRPHIYAQYHVDTITGEYI